MPQGNDELDERVFSNKRRAILQEGVLFVPLMSEKSAQAKKEKVRTYQLNGLDPATGKVLWSKEYPDNYLDRLYTLSVQGDAVYPSVYGDEKGRKKPWIRH